MNDKKSKKQPSQDLETCTLLHDEPQTIALIHLPTYGAALAAFFDLLLPRPAKPNK